MTWRSRLVAVAGLVGCTAPEHGTSPQAGAPHPACVGNVAAIVNGSDAYALFEDAFFAAVPGPSDIEVCPGAWHVTNQIVYSGVLELRIWGSDPLRSSIHFDNSGHVVSSFIEHGNIYINNISIHGGLLDMIGTNTTYNIDSVNSSSISGVAPAGFRFGNGPGNTTTVTNSNFIGAQLASLAQDSVTIDNCTFSDNLGASFATLDVAHVAISNSEFSYNASTIGDATSIGIEYFRGYALYHGNTPATVDITNNTFIANTVMRDWPTGGLGGVIDLSVDEHPPSVNVHIEDNLFDSNLGNITSVMHITGRDARGPVNIDVIGGAMYRNGWLPQIPARTIGPNGTEFGSLFGGNQEKGPFTRLTLHDVDLGVGPTENLGDVIPYCHKTGVTSGTFYENGVHPCP